MATEFRFTLKYQLSADDADLDAIVERLGAGGCDDATAGVGLPGRLALAFTREADSAAEAVGSAVADVRRLVPSARMIEVGPDLVGLTDVAELMGMTRQNMRKLMLTNAATFPAPIHEGSATSIWHLADILAWLEARGTYAPPPEVMELARAALHFNVAKESERIAPAAGVDSARAAA